MCYCLDLRSDSKLAKCLSHKLISVLVAVIQLIIWAASILTLIKQQLRNSPAGEIAFSVILILAGVGFSVLLLLGIIKSNRIFIKVFLAFNIGVIVYLVMGIIYIIFTQPTRIGLSGFLFLIFVILLEVLTYFIIRNYYLGLIRPTGHVQNNSPRGMGV